MNKMLVLSATVIAVTALLPVQPHAQGGRGGGPQMVVVGQLAGKPVVQPVTRGVDYRDAISPTDPAMNGPVPRLPDGHPDLTGPWEGGGSDNDIGVEGGLKPGELDTYLLPAAKTLKDQRSKAIYGEHPGSSSGVTKESLQKITRDALVAFHKENYIPDYAIIAISGDISLADARTKFQNALKEWTKTGKPRPGVVDPAAHGPMKIYIVNRPSSVQTNYLLGEQAINRVNPDFDALQVMNRVLGGQNGRLFRVLREEKGYTYGASSGVRALRYRGDWRASMDVRTDVTEPSLRDLLVELGRMRDQLVPAAELQDAQRSMTASFALSLENPSEVLNLYVLRQMYGYPADYWDKYSDRIMAVTPAQVQAVAKKYLDPTKLQIVAVGDSSKIEASLKKIGPVEMYDDEGKPVAGSPASPTAR